MELGTKAPPSSLDLGGVGIAQRRLRSRFSPSCPGFESQPSQKLFQNEFLNGLIREKKRQ